MKQFFTRFAYASAVLLMAGYAYFALRGPQGIPGLMQKRQQIQELEKSNALLARQVEQKRAHIDRLKDSPPEQENAIWNRLRMVKPGQKIFILHDREAK